jgi:hypothetical protein
MYSPQRISLEELSIADRLHAASINMNQRLGILSSSEYYRERCHCMAAVTVWATLKAVMRKVCTGGGHV